MMYIIEHPQLLLSFITVPLFGWIFHECISKKIILYIMLSCSILLMPFLTGYRYIVPNGYAVLIYLLLVCGYSLMLENNPGKILTTVIISFVLIPIFGIMFFIGSMGGSVNVEQSWEFEGYKVEYIRDQGFAGRPLMKYELNKYGILPIFIKHVDTQVDNATTNNCVIRFSYKSVSFNKCKQ